MRAAKNPGRFILLVALLMGIGALAGQVASGQLDLHALAGVFTGRRTSS